MGAFNWPVSCVEKYNLVEYFLKCSSAVGGTPGKRNIPPALSSEYAAGKGWKDRALDFQGLILNFLKS